MGREKFEKNHSAASDDDKKMQKDDKQEHPHVLCDNCDCRVKGIRYKCQQCPDYDLCRRCEKTGQHYHHLMTRIASPDLLNKRTKKPGKRPCGRLITNAETLSRKQSGEMHTNLVDNGMDFLKDVSTIVVKTLNNLGINRDDAKEKLNGSDEKPTTVPIGRTTEDIDTPPRDETHSNSGNDWTLLEDKSEEKQLYPNDEIAGNGPIHHPDERVQETLSHLKSMGFLVEDEGWLVQLVQIKKGDINAVLNSLQPRR